MGLGDKFSYTLKCCEFVSYNATAPLTEVIVISHGRSKGIIKGQNGTLEMLRIKQPPRNVKNPISILFHS